MALGHFLPEAYEMGKIERERMAVDRLVRDLCVDTACVAHLPSGAPVIAGIDDPLFISVSHCATAAVIAVSPDSRIGIDIEQQRPQLRRVRQKYLSPRELEIFDTPQLMLIAWTAKEAVYKAALTPGLPLHDIELSLPEPSFGGVAMRSQAIARRMQFGLTHIPIAADTMLTLARPTHPMR